MISDARITERGRFTGVAQIVRYNWPQYLAAIGVGVIGAIVLLAFRFGRVVEVVGWFGIAVATSWAAASLVVSHVVYDRSSLYQWTWLKRVLPRTPARWIGVHAGLDESSRAISEQFGLSPKVVLDIYDPSEMTERSIERARKTSAGGSACVSASFAALPVDDAAVDCVMVVFAAHELRREASRVAFFSELRRITARDGVVIVVEHLRDAANFAAFGPGFAHFLSRRTWLRAFTSARLVVGDEFRITPFVRVFALRPDA